MLGNRDAIANIAVKDLEAARRFYAETLGLKQIDQKSGEVLVFKSGNARLHVYRSSYAGTNQATAITWSVGKDLDGIVDELRGRGIKFEHYDLPNSTREGDIHTCGDMRVVWFKDPDGNILNLINA